MKLSIIIVNYNTFALTRACIVSCLNQATRIEKEIIVIDNHSHDESVALLRSDFPEVTVLANDANKGLAAGVNQALAVARGEYLLILNPDVTPKPGAIHQLVTWLDTHPAVGMVGGQLRDATNRLQPSCFRFYRLATVMYRRTGLGRTPRGRADLKRFLMRDIDHARPRPVEWLMGSCLLVRRRAVEEVGGMDERFFLYFEDVDWCRRFWLAGWQVMYVPGAQFIHFHQRQSQGTLRDTMVNWATREHIRSALKYFWKYRQQALPSLRP